MHEARTKRRVRPKPSSAFTTRRGNARSRQYVQMGGKSRGARLSTRNSRHTSLSTESQSAVASRRVTRSSTNRLIPIHHHGVHPDVGSLCDNSNELDDDEGSQAYYGLIGQCLMTPWQISEPMSTTPWGEQYDDSSECNWSDTMSGG